MVELTLREEIDFCCGTCADKMKIKQGYEDLLEIAYTLATNYPLSETYLKAKTRLITEYSRRG